MAGIFRLTMPLWETFTRATVIYFALVLLVRVIPKRNAGALSPSDILTLVVVGIGTDAMMGGSESVGDLLLVVRLVVGWSYVIDVMDYRFPASGRVFRDRQTPLIEDGRLLRRNMRREMITEEELGAVCARAAWPACRRCARPVWRPMARSASFGARADAHVPRGLARVVGSAARGSSGQGWRG